MQTIRYLGIVACLAAILVPRVMSHCEAVGVTEPTSELRTLVDPVGKALASHPQKAAIALYFAAVAEALDRDAAGPKYIATCESLRRWNEVAESRFRGELSPKVDGLADKLNAVFLKWVGSDAVQMDAERYRKASEAARAIQWATQ